MKLINLTKKHQDNIFRPTGYLKDGEFVDIDTSYNWLDDNTWSEYISYVVKVADDIAIVEWLEPNNEGHTRSVYKGVFIF